MAIYIKGVELPESCACCDFRVFDGINDECRVLRKFMRGWEYQDGFPTDCPLVYITEPHGRLIDERVAYDKIAEQETGYYMDMDGVDRGLQDTPTVIEGSE